jgi:hypothetical protein
LLGFQHDVGPLWELVLEFCLDAVIGGPRKVAVVRSRLDARDTACLGRPQEKEACGRRYRLSHEDLEDVDMTDAVDDEVVSWREPAGSKDIAAKRLRISVDAGLPEVLERFARRRIAAKAGQLAAQIVAKTGARPTKLLSHRGTYR